MSHKIIDITPKNLPEYDLFCKKSKKKEDRPHKQLEVGESIRPGCVIPKDRINVTTTTKATG